MCIYVKMDIAKKLPTELKWIIMSYAVKHPCKEEIEADDFGGKYVNGIRMYEVDYPMTKNDVMNYIYEFNAECPDCYLYANNTITTIRRNRRKIVKSF